MTCVVHKFLDMYIETPETVVLLDLPLHFKPNCTTQTLRASTISLTLPLYVWRGFTMINVTIVIDNIIPEIIEVLGMMLINIAMQFIPLAIISILPVSRPYNYVRKNWGGRDRAGGRWLLVINYAIEPLQSMFV